MWVRGLKLRVTLLSLPLTRRTLCGCVDWNFASRGIGIGSNRRTLCGCVDWNLSTLCHLVKYLVAPYVGAWIETFERPAILNAQMSHPMWVRGLKLQNSLVNAQRKSRALCGCVDWNKLFVEKTCDTFVAPYVGAWIETWQQATEQSRHLVAPYVGACIKLYCCSVKTWWMYV